MSVHDHERLRQLAWIGIALILVLGVVEGLLLRLAPALACELGMLPLWPALVGVGLAYGAIAWRRRPRLSLFASVLVLIATVAAGGYGGWEAGVGSLLGLGALAAAAIAWADARNELALTGSDVGAWILSFAMAAAPLAFLVIGSGIWAITVGAHSVAPTWMTVVASGAMASSLCLVVALAVVDHRAYRRAGRLLDEAREAETA
jgi:hypothetical protein